MVFSLYVEDYRVDVTKPLKEGVISINTPLTVNVTRLVEIHVSDRIFGSTQLVSQVKGPYQKQITPRSRIVSVGLRGDPKHMLKRVFLPEQNDPNVSTL